MMKASYINTSIELVYETPNYKVWIGDFYSQLEADKKLLMIKKKYPEAFIFRTQTKGRRIMLIQRK
jgi:hypothetical protein